MMKPNAIMRVNLKPENLIKLISLEKIKSSRAKPTEAKMLHCVKAGLRPAAYGGSDNTVSEDLIRKRAEHNECIISTLEEISLHQQDIERIEYIDKWCRDLKILYLQSNLIPKIENVGRLKKLEYLNLALNNVEVIENLQGCESLNKLDLTVNFVGELTSIENLVSLCHLRELFLTGNPCTEYDGYRDYVIAILPQLQYLDGIEIEKSERILATQKLTENRGWIMQQQANYKKKREREKAGERKGTDGRWYTNTDETKIEEVEMDEITQEEKEKRFWEEKTAYTPESRVKLHEHLQESRKRENSEKESKPKPERRLQMEDGKILNVNEAKIDFSLTDNEEENLLLLDVAVYKHMDTSLCDVDVQTTHIKVTIKGKILQLVLPEEVKPDSSSAKRSQITGHLLITMPKAYPVITKPHPAPEPVKPAVTGNKGPEKLEVDPSLKKDVDFGNIVSENGKPVKLLGPRMGQVTKERENSEGFIDDPDVPPLM